MPTAHEQKLMEQALAEMKKAQWPPRKWCASIQDGYPPGHEYNWMVTHNYKVQDLMWQAAHPTPPPIPVPPPINPQALNHIYCAQEPWSAMNAKVGYVPILSADMAYRYPNNDYPAINLHDVVGNLRARFGSVGGWCDCRPAPGGTPAKEGLRFCSEYHLDFFVGQAEHDFEFDDAVSNGAKMVIGNVTNLRNDQLSKISSREVALIQEDYWNEGWARAQWEHITAYAAGIYPALWNPTILAYREANRWRDGDGVYYSATVQDWANLP